MTTEVGNQTNDWGLTTDEAGRLYELEAVIAENFQGFYAVGCALAEINQKKLYRQTHNTFEDYCRKRFEVSRQSAYRYIEAKKIMDNLSPIGDKTKLLSASGGQIELMPINEAQVRPLTRLEPDAQVDAWKEVVKSAPFDGGITARHVSEVVAGLIGKEIEKKAAKIKKEIEPIVSKEFSDVVWTLIEVVRAEVQKPLKVKTKKVMIESLQRVEKLLED